MKEIYLDNNSTTPTLPAVWEAMQPHFLSNSANPASSHHAGRKARLALENAREQTAELLGASAEEVIFTSGATEANNLALFGLIAHPPQHILHSAVEHPCVIEPMERLKKSGFDIGVIPVDQFGRISTEEYRKHLQDDTRLVAVMLANHETGTVQPIQQLVRMTPDGVSFHCDAAAAAGKTPIEFQKLGVTSMTISAHKFHGPKGIGAMVLRKGTKLHPLLFGGHQQKGHRPGTEPVPLAVGLATALSLAVNELESRTLVVRQLRERFLAVLRDSASPVIVNGSEQDCVPHTLNLSFPGVNADVLLMNFDLAGIACSTGSACSSGSLLPSPVIRAMNVSEEKLMSAMRFSFSHLLTITDVEEAAERIAEIVQRLRSYI